MQSVLVANYLAGLRREASSVRERDVDWSEQPPRWLALRQLSANRLLWLAVDSLYLEESDFAESGQQVRADLSAEWADTLGNVVSRVDLPIGVRSRPWPAATEDVLWTLVALPSGEQALLRVRR